MALVTVKAVDDQATPEFMADFYNEWLSNPKDDPALALQTVKARWRNDPSPSRNDPRKWAPFILIENAVAN